MVKTRGRIGFEGFESRRFLDEAEWRTYRRRRPVRYTDKPKAKTCEMCGEPAGLDDPLQNAHIIGFTLGVIQLGLTPDFLDSHENLKTAHTRKCNRECELDLEQCMKRLRALDIQEIPKYLPAETQALWRATGAKKRSGVELESSVEATHES